MRSITQNIVLDRLQNALASRGVDLKRSAVLEIASETFGFVDGNAFVAAMKEGRFDPPVAEPLGMLDVQGCTLALLRDPTNQATYALDLTALPAATRKTRMAVSPYGRLLQLPDQDAATTRTVLTAPPVPVRVDRKIVHVVDHTGHASDPEVDAWRHLLDTQHDIEIECEPVGCIDVTAHGMARIEGRLFFVFGFGEEYDSHEAGIWAARRYADHVAARTPIISRLGGIMMWEDDTAFGRVDATLFLPADLAHDVDDIRDWHEAIAILMGADHETVTATFGPQVWVKDDALDTDPEGETDIDVTVEVLLMGSKAAREVEDYRDSSDEFQSAVLAPDWIRDWKGPFYVEVADGIADYLDDRRIAKEEDEQEDWSCDNCGETAQDGSGVCITCGLDSSEEQDDVASQEGDEDENADDRPDDSVCDDCDQTIDYDTGRCSGCGRDWSEVEQGRVDAGVLRTVLPDDVDHLKRQPDIGDPV